MRRETGAHQSFSGEESGIWELTGLFTPKSERTRKSGR